MVLSTFVSLFSKLKAFKFDEKIKKTFFKFHVDNFREMFFKKQLVSFLICAYIIIFTNIAKHLCFRFIN